MHKTLFGILFFPILASAQAGNQRSLEQLPLWSKVRDKLYGPDWLLDTTNTRAGIYRTADDSTVILFNGLVRRSFALKPDAACFDFRNMSNGQQLLRSVKPEASITLNGIAYDVGGRSGQKENAYLLPEWLPGMPADAAFRFTSLETASLTPFLKGQPKAWTGRRAPATGMTLTMNYVSRLPVLRGITVQVHYELYDGMPLIVKWVSIRNAGPTAVHLDRVKSEVLGVVEEESAVVVNAEKMANQHGLYVETNYAFNNAMRYTISDQTTHWKPDTSYTSQVSYDLRTPCLLEVYPDKAPGIDLQPGEDFQSVRTCELLIDTYDRERRGLAIRRMYRIVAPWTTANPIFMHLVSQDDEQVRTAIDQCAATGYEALILSFGSHCNMEDTSAGNISRWSSLAAYAHRKGVLIGGYSLFSSRRISDEDDVIDPATGLPDKNAFFGQAPCLGSKWGLAYLQKLKTFLSATGFDIFENDGPYPGDLCASTHHPGHKGLDDSQWRQMELQKGLYHYCNEHGIYVNAPDWYFLDGTNKAALGYREDNFSLPRDQQRILNRQNIYDGLWERIPSMCWGFVPLTRYHGGGPEAVLEPLKDHLPDYRQLMMQYYGAGVQACYRGPRLYDTPATLELVRRVVAWYKQYRDILNADIIHLRRADGRDWDGWMHVDPALEQKGFAMLYNPRNEPMELTLKLPLYYTGIKGTALISVEGRPAKPYKLDPQHNIKVTVRIPAQGNTWLVVQ